jgi:hypothetical protein
MNKNNRKELLLAIAGFVAGAVAAGLFSRCITSLLLARLVSGLVGGAFGLFAVINPVNFGEFLVYGVLTGICVFAFVALSQRPAIPEIVRHWALPLFGSVLAGGCLGKLTSLIFRRPYDT